MHIYIYFYFYFFLSEQWKSCTKLTNHFYFISWYIHIFYQHSTFDSLVNKGKREGERSMGCPLVPVPCTSSFSAQMVD